MSFQVYTVALFAGVGLILTSASCLMDQAAEQHENHEAPSELELLEDDLSDKAGDSYVQFCNRPNHTDGTICIQHNCSGDRACHDREGLAYEECRREVRQVCGRASEPWFIIYKADGYKERIYP